MKKKFFYVAVLCALVLPGVAQADVGSLLAVTKQVRNVSTGSGFASSVSARAGETVEYDVKVQNVSTSTLYNIAISDTLSSIPGTRTTLSVSRAYTGQLENGTFQLQSLEAGGTADVVFQVVLQNSTSVNTACSVATATVNSQAVSSSACVYISPVSAVSVSPTLIRQSLIVTNDTKNVSGTVVNAGKEDFLTFAFTVTNSGTGQQFGYVPTVDLSGVLPLVDTIDLGGGRLSGSTLTFPATDIAPGASVTKSLRVRVKYYLPPYNFVLKLSFGNDVQVNVQNTAAAGVVYTAPNTGAAIPMGAVLFGLIAVLALLFAQKRVRTILFT